MKKQDVYVVVDTPKKAKKLKDVLDMFGEKTCMDDTISNALNSKECVHFNEKHNNSWCWSIPIVLENKTKVSIKQLKQILAKEHLRKGDVVLISSFKGEYESILKIKSVKGEHLKVDKQVFVKGSDSIYNDGQEMIRDFKRYATPEEVELLEPREEKKELEAGNWHKVSGLQNGCVGFSGFGQIVLNEKCDHGLCEDKDKSKAILIRGVNGVVWRINSDAKFTEATPQEVESALIEEAKRRYKVGDNVKSLVSIGDFSGKLDFKEISCYDGYNELWISGSEYNIKVFHNGKWATIIEQDKFAELKEAHKNGFGVEFRRDERSEWKRHDNPCWSEDLEWRLMLVNGHPYIRDNYLRDRIDELGKRLNKLKNI